MVDDIDASRHLLRDRIGELPQFLFGHSMGGNLAISYTLRWPHRLNGLMLSAPMMLPSKPPKRDQIFAAWLTGRLLPFIRIKAPVDSTQMTHDPREIQLIETDPLMHAKLSLHLATQLIAQGRWALDQAAKLTLPLLVLHGEEDATTDIAASEAFCLRVGPHAKIERFSGMYHDLLHEIDHHLVVQSIVDWLEIQLSGRVK